MTFCILAHEFKQMKRTWGKRLAKSWEAIIRMNKTGDHESLQKELKIQFFHAPVESVLLYGAESWTLTQKLKDTLDGNLKLKGEFTHTLIMRLHLYNIAH